MHVSELIQDSKNANAGTARGRKAVAESLKRFGAGRSIVIDRDGKIIAGNQTVSQAESAGITEILVVPTDGTKLIAVQRTDLSLDDPKAKELAIADNRTGQLGLEWDPAVLGELSADLDLKPFFSGAELSKIIAPDMPPEPGDSSEEIDVDSFELSHRCPKCGFEFNDDK